MQVRSASCRSSASTISPMFFPRSFRLVSSSIIAIIPAPCRSRPCARVPMAQSRRRTADPSDGDFSRLELRIALMCRYRGGVSLCSAWAHAASSRSSSFFLESHSVFVVDLFDMLCLWS